jgi:hypothetical protein
LAIWKDELNSFFYLKQGKEGKRKKKICSFFFFLLRRFLKLYCRLFSFSFFFVFLLPSRTECERRVGNRDEEPWTDGERSVSNGDEEPSVQSVPTK